MGRLTKKLNAVTGTVPWWRANDVLGSETLSRRTAQKWQSKSTCSCTEGLAEIKMCNLPRSISMYGSMIFSKVL